MGVHAMASNSYAMRTLLLHIVLSFSLASASQILMAHWMGARRIDEINRLYWKIINLSVVVSLVYMTIIWSNANSIISIFTNDPTIKQTAKHLLFISLFTEPARVVNIISGFTLRSVGDTRYPMIIGMIFIWGILPFIFAWDAIWTLSIVNMWICFSADEIIRCLINLQRWKSGKWKSMGFVRPEENMEVSVL
jgi:Na+-driven multidrug efflux pump